ncbi:hypothetical protein RBWH47_01267 [Rhodopirellula baltica WH47]|uniref:Uncharacterized protein n=1 Tax=Rhodopirellula baltica WH47 TaxID=991778 RepID=F2AQN9_RHOBT|nr:hypothetical protein RBWH47_01267 [Rhodopirellula baltica WH47]
MRNPPEIARRPTFFLRLACLAGAFREWFRLSPNVLSPSNSDQETGSIEFSDWPD